MYVFDTTHAAPVYMLYALAIQDGAILLSRYALSCVTGS